MSGSKSLEYYEHWEEFPYEYFDILWMSDTMSWIIGVKNLAAIEADYQANEDAPYLGASALGLTEDDVILFNHLVTIGNAYELLTSVRHIGWKPEDLIQLMLADRVVNGGRNIDALVAALLAQPKVAERNEGLLDVGVNRDQVANRLGIQFGIQVFNNPSVAPVIPHDVGKAGFEWCRQVPTDRGPKDVCHYRFP